MIGIRSITYQLPEYFTKRHIEQVAATSREWDSIYELVRTQRVSLYPYTKEVAQSDFRELSNLCETTSVRWFNVPINPVECDDIGELFKFAYATLSEYGCAFVNVLGVMDGKININILKSYADLMRKVSVISDGNDNFRLGMSINVKPDGPFFPFSYSSGRLGFSIGLELTQEINMLCRNEQNKDLITLRKSILDCLIPQIERINEMANIISKQMGLEFKGFDFSLAPIIDPNGSVVTILNTLGIYDFGRTGSLFATSFITNILKYFASRFKSVGFSGVMYSLLEDLELCSINNERGVTLEQLITLSTMCGCGVDMVPVYGQISNDEFISIVLDVAGISSRLNKPLGIRILPIQHCKRGNSSYTCFHTDSDFISNTRVVNPSLNLVSEIGSTFNYLEV